MTTTRVKNLVNDNNNAAANQFVIRTTKAVYFQSYRSVVCKREGDETGKIILSQHWDYSNTTRKHLYIFLRDYTCYKVRSKQDVLKLIKDKVFTLSKVESLPIK